MNPLWGPKMSSVLSCIRREISESGEELAVQGPLPSSTKLLASHRPQVAKCRTLGKNTFWGAMIKIRPSRCGEKVGGSHLANSYQTAVHLSSKKLGKWL